MASASHPFYTLVFVLAICHHGLDAFVTHSVTEPSELSSLDRCHQEFLSSRSGTCALGSSVKIQVTSQYQNDFSPNAVNIRCTLEPRGNCAKTINLLKISKDAGKTIAGIQRDDSIFYDRLRRSGVKAEGHIDRDHNNRTFFSLTVRDAMKEDSGLYSCIIHYIDEYGNLKDEASSHNVTIHDQDLQDVVRHLMAEVSFLKNLMKFQQETADERTASLERKLYDHEDEIKQKVSELEEAGMTRGHKIQEIVDRDSFSSAFSVHGTKTPFNNGETLVFKTSLLNVGNHYNMATGVFTAPRKGLYVFHLYLTGFSKHDFHVHLRLNGRMVAVVFTYDPATYDQSSASTVLSLNRGDDVLPYMANGGKLAWTNQPFSAFSGYLLQQL